MIKAIRQFWSASIRRQLIIGIALVHAVLMSLFVFDLVERQRTFLHDEQVADTMSLIRGLARNSTSWVLASDVAGLEEVLQGFADYPELRYAMVLDKSGRVLAHTDKTLIGKFASDSISLKLQTAAPVEQILVDTDRVIDVAAPVLVNQRLLAWVRLSTGREHSSRGLQVVTMNGVIYTLAAIAIGTLVAFFMARGLTRSLYNLLHVAEATRSGRRDLRARIEHDNEAGKLAESFNRMLDALADGEKRLRDLNDELELRVQQRTADLAAANEDVRNFAYIVSHDLRAPLVNIQGFCGELRYGLDDLRAELSQQAGAIPAHAAKRLQDTIDDDMEEALRFIDIAARKMDGQINALLKLSRLGRQSIRPEPVDLGEIVGSAVDALHHEIHAAGGNAVVESLPNVVADRISIEQIVANLLSNAVKYVEPGRPLQLRVWADTSDDGTVLHVQDNGRGMAADDIPRAFDLFRRVGRQDTRGEGMGLSYVQTLVRRHSGRIWCDSELGAGTTFHVFFPRLYPADLTASIA